MYAVRQGLKAIDDGLFRGSRDRVQARSIEPGVDKRATDAMDIEVNSTLASACLCPGRFSAGGVWRSAAEVQGAGAVVDVTCRRQ